MVRGSRRVNSVLEPGGLQNLDRPVRIRQGI